MGSCGIQGRMSASDWLDRRLPTLEAAFAPLAAVLVAFGERYGLVREEFPRCEPAWRFCFSHPRGGSAHVEVRGAEESLEIAVASGWWVDDFRGKLRRVRRGPSVRVEPRPAHVIATLEEHFRGVLAWEPEAWDGEVDCRRQWRGHTSWELSQMGPRYPRPHLGPEEETHP